MKPTAKRTLKKVFLNVMASLAALVVTGNVIAGENLSVVNDAFGTVSSKIVSTAPAGVDEGYVRYFDSQYKTVADLKAAGEAKVREVESEGIVLMKNDNNTLPFAAGAKVSLVGVTVMDPVYGGTGSGAVDADGAPNYLDVLTGAGFNVVNKPLLDYYVSEELKRDGHGINELAWKKVKKNHDDTMGQGEDVVYVVGRVGGEGNDVGLGIEDTYEEAGDYLHLNNDELSVLKGLKEMKEDGDVRSVTLIVNSANPISLGFVDDEEYGVDAVLWVGSVGQTGLYALGDVLTGAVNPSGSLPDTWWMDNQLDPVEQNRGAYTYSNADGYSYPANPSSFNKYVVYQEGVYMGYKYTETRYEDKVLGTPNTGDFTYGNVVAYPFGYGLSYTNFEASDMKVEKTGSGLNTEYNVTVTVTNTGKQAGKKAVQVYAQKPYTQYDIDNKIEKPSVEFVGFGKTKLLQPGESETVTVSVPEYFLTSYDAYNTGVFILEEGTHYLTVANDAHDAVNNILAQKGKTVADGMTAAGKTDLVYAIDYSFDAATYAKAYGTGAEVKSLFEAADLTRYEGTKDAGVSYYSRNNWVGTVTGTVMLAMNDKIFADVVLTDDDLPSAAGYTMPTMGKNNNLQLINMRGVAYDDPQWDDFMDQMTYEQMAKICVNGLRMTYGINEIGKPQTVDHNGPSGVTQKYSVGSNGYAVQNDDPNKDMKGTCYPCNGIVAATMNAKLVEEVGELIGEDAMWAGYAGLYGTGLNIHRSPYAGRVFEYYSEDGILTGLIDTVETIGIQSKGVYVYNKHFVLNDQEDNRAGIGTWCNEQALREIYLRAFELPIIRADAKCVMTAFNRLGVMWAGAYPELLTNWLRGEAGMSGFAVTDMYDGTYMVKVNEIVAGNDIPDNFVGEDISEVAAYKDNAMVAQAMRTSAKRVLHTVVNSRGMDGISQYTKVVAVTPWWQMLLNIAQWTTIVLTALGCILLTLDVLGIGGKKKAKKA